MKFMSDAGEGPCVLLLIENYFQKSVIFKFSFIWTRITVEEVWQTRRVYYDEVSFTYPELTARAGWTLSALIKGTDEVINFRF